MESPELPTSPSRTSRQRGPPLERPSQPPDPASAQAEPQWQEQSKGQHTHRNFEKRRLKKKYKEALKQNPGAARAPTDPPLPPKAKRQQPKAQPIGNKQARNSSKQAATDNSNSKQARNSNIRPTELSLPPKAKRQQLTTQEIRNKQARSNSKQAATDNSNSKQAHTVA
jgi:hypothetical protein